MNRVLNKRIGIILGVSIIIVLVACLSQLKADAVKSGKKKPTECTLNTACNAFIGEMVKKHGFDKSKLTALFNHVYLKPNIIDAITRPYEAKPWYLYKKLFITQKRVNGGVAFWQEHEQTLADAEKQFGVPAEMVVAIVGIESNYGKNTGGFRVVDALATLSFKYPKRSQFFRSELEQFLLLSRDMHFEPETQYGSYAGAMGPAQFMPSSVQSYAIDFGEDGKVDMQSDFVDIIGSVANYFKSFGWDMDQQVAIPATANDKSIKTLLDEDGDPQREFSELKKMGVKPSVTIADEEHVKLIKLNNLLQPEYWVVFHNFYVITRYNHSSLYAMAAYQLSQQIKEQKERLNNDKTL